MAEENTQEKNDFLKREEIKTMEKDVSRLRELEAEKEKERIAALKTDPLKTSPEAKTAEALPEPIQEKDIGLLIPKVKNKPSFFKKILIRAAFVVILILAAWAIYWLFAKDSLKPDESPGINQPQEQKETPATTSTENKELETPKAEEILQIEKRIVSWGYYIPKSPRIIDTIVIHSAYNALGGDVYNLDKVIQEFKTYKVTSHYIIDRNGSVFQLAPDNAIAYQAGRSVMPDGSRRNIINNFSIGIEMIYGKNDSPNKDQYKSLAKIINLLKNKYEIPLENILGHKDIHSTKTDPWNFNDEYFNSLINN